jgi:hypothetical protein
MVWPIQPGRRGQQPRAQRRPELGLNRTLKNPCGNWKEQGGENPKPYPTAKVSFHGSWSPLIQSFGFLWAN